MSLLAIIFAYFVSFWVSIGIGVLYFVGLFVVIIFSNKRGKLYEKRMLLNMGVIVANMNFNVGEIWPTKSLF